MPLGGGPGQTPPAKTPNKVTADRRAAALAAVPASAVVEGDGFQGGEAVEGLEAFFTTEA